MRGLRSEPAPDTFVTVGKIQVGGASSEKADARGVPVHSRTDPDGDPLAQLTAIQGTRLTAKVMLKPGEITELVGWGSDLTVAIEAALGGLCKAPFRIASHEICVVPEDPKLFQAQVWLRSSKQPESPLVMGVGCAKNDEGALLTATLRALMSAALLKGGYTPPGQQDVHGAAIEISNEIADMLPGVQRSDRFHAEMVHIVQRGLNRFALGQTVIAVNAAEQDRMLSRFDASSAVNDGDGTPLTSNTDTKKWWEWFPGLDNGELTLGEVYEKLPAVPADDVPYIVKLFENPKGWLKFRGAIELKEHDMLHILLGRGLQDQDEAFVLGFTMATTKNLTRLEQWAFKAIVSNLYQEPYRISKELLKAYDFGVEAGNAFGIKNIHKIDFTPYLDRPLSEVRAALGIDVTKLQEIYHREKQALPNTLASVRLPSLVPVDETK